jgi:hypothetical protein
MFNRPLVTRRGRKPPPYGPRLCFWCCSLLRYDLKTQRHFCPCGWREQP